MKEKIIWAAVGALVILLFVGIFWLGKMYGSKSNPLPANLASDEKVSVDQSGTVSVEKPVPASNTPASTAGNSANGDAGQSDLAQENPLGWKVYTNKNQDYAISYPKNGKIEQPDPNDFSEGSAPAEGSCVTARFSGGYVTIFGKNNDPDMAGACIGTGIGTEWNNISAIEVEVFGKKYSVKGMGTSSASAGYRQEFYVVEPTSGERIRFGIEVNEKYAPELPYEKAKAEVLDVLKNLKHT